MLVLHLGAELRRLEQALAVPLQRVDLRLRGREAPATGAGQQPLVEERQVVASASDRVLGLIDQAVVLGVEDGVDGGEADVLVHAAVAGDVVRVEQLVVVGARCRRRADVDDVVGIGREQDADVVDRIGAVGDVDQELVAGAHGVGQI